jgi:hypothetical protein
VSRVAVVSARVGRLKLRAAIQALARLHSSGFS